MAGRRSCAATKGPAVEELNEALQRNPSFAFARVMLAVAHGYAG
jgi:hypothetical protein